jgi:hypothetical protein
LEFPYKELRRSIGVGLQTSGDLWIPHTKAFTTWAKAKNNCQFKNNKFNVLGRLTKKVPNQSKNEL